MSGLRGDLGALARMADGLRYMPEVAERAAARSADALTASFRASFDARTAPDGAPFRSTKDGRTPSLVASGRVRDRIRFEAIGRKLRVSLASVPYARYLIRFGFLPRGGEPLPARWKATIDDAIKTELAEAGAR